MREIKFRAWNTKSNKMFSAEEMAEDQMTLLPTGQFINVHSASTNLSQIYPLDIMIPMQYIGKDKNEKDIYEGDRVVIIDEHGNDDSGYVWYIPERMAYCIVWHEGESTYNISDTKKDQIEVTGNIYED